MFFFNNNNYILADLIKLLGLSYYEIGNRIDDLITAGYLKLEDDTILRITIEGKQLLHQKALDISFSKLLKPIPKNIIFDNRQLEEIYIPKRFRSKFQGYLTGNKRD